LSSKSKGSVVSKLSEGHQKEVNENREYLTKLIEILLYLSRQGIPLRGHFEDKDSLNQGSYQVLKISKYFFEKLIANMTFLQEISKRLVIY